MSYTELCECYDANFKVRKYNSIIYANPRYWKKVLCEENYIQVACKYGNLIERQKWGGAIYSALNGTDDIILERLLCWKEKFSNVEITQEIVKNAFKNINKITKIVKYHAFQYKLLFNSTYLGSRLVHMGLVDTNLCVLCNKEKEEIVHFFCNCEIANTIWQSLAKWIYEEWNVSINLHNLPKYIKCCSMMHMITWRVPQCVQVPSSCTSSARIRDNLRELGMKMSNFILIPSLFHSILNTNTNSSQPDIVPNSNLIPHPLSFILP